MGTEITDLEKGFAAETASSDAESWYLHLDGFADASIYQSWHWGVTLSGSNRVSHLVLKRSGKVLALAQVRLFNIPHFPGGFAFVRWGPVWQPKGGGRDSEVFRQAIRALRNEFVVRRKMVLRILPRLFEDDDGNYAEILEQEGFCEIEGRGEDKTLILDLSPPLEELRSGLLPKWRNHLNKAERQGLLIRMGKEETGFEDFRGVFETMLRRKKFEPTSDLEAHKRVQCALPDRFKMEVLNCRSAGQICAAAILSSIGDTSLYLFGATNETGMKTSASYLLQWESLKLLKERGVSRYDLHGVNPESNPGTYSFKKGLAGKTGREAKFLGQFQAVQPSLANYSVLAVDALRHRIRRFMAGAG